jgi:hypothetical protein
MATNYSWVISQLECYPNKDGKTDVVFIVHWRREATNGAYATDVYGAQTIVFESSAPFTPYEQLTQAQIESWLVDSMGIDGVAALDAKLDQQISNLQNPPVVTPPLPWAS